MLEREREALLAPLPERGRQRGARRLAQMALRGPARRRLAGTRDRRAQQVAIDQRRPHLERVGHAHRVDVAQELHLQVLADLERADPLVLG